MLVTGADVQVGAVQAASVTAAQFSGDGSGLTKLDATRLAGQVPSGSLPVGLAFTTGGATFAGDLAGRNVSAAGGKFQGDGSALTGLSAAQLGTGTLADGRLSGSYSGTLSFPGNVTLGSPTVTGSLGIGTTGAPAAKLDVNGGIRLGNDTGACDATRAGTLRWSGTSLDVCSGNAWLALAFPFTPTSLPGLKVWLRNDAGLPAAGTAVSTWGDQSGNALNFTQGTASRQPTVVASVLAGRPVVQFSATASQTLTNATNFPAPVTVLYVAHMSGPTHGRILAGLANNWLLGWWGTSMDQGFFEGWVSQPASAANGSWALYSMVTNGSTSSVYRNGTLLATNANGVTGPNGLSLDGHGATSEFSDAQIAEVLVYSAALGNAQRAQVETYLNQRHGVY